MTTTLAAQTPAIDSSVSDNEAQYNLPPDMPVREIGQGWKTDSELARASTRNKLDLSYGDRPREYLDLFLPPETNDKTPLLMFFHGGYWQFYSPKQSSWVAPEFLKDGVAVAVVGYTLAPEVTLDKIVNQARSATSYLYKNAENFGINPERIFASGHSAGGQLTGMLMATRWPEFSPGLPETLIKGGLAISGVFDLDPLRFTTFNNNLQLDEESARRNSPLYLMPATRAPLYLAVGGEETAAFHAQTSALAQVRQQQGVQVTHIAMPRHHHLSVVRQLGVRGSPLFNGAIRMIGR